MFILNCKKLTNMCIIKTKNVNKLYGKKKVIDNLKFVIAQNEFAALIGNNGVGKTTTLKIICNLINFSGDLYVRGEKIKTNDYKFRKDFGIIFDDYILIDEFTVYEYFRFLNKVYCLENQSSRINELIYLFGLQHESNSQINTLSSGNKMKLLLIASLLHDPAILIYDEPFINIDVKTMELFVDILKSFRGKKTLFITSHNLDLAINLCDRFLIMESGKIIMDLQKADYLSTNDLKNTIKNKLTDDSFIKDISWLNDLTKRT